MIRPTDNPQESDYWISSGETVVYDAGENMGSGGNLHFSDRLRISKGAVGGCTSTVTLDIEGNPLMYSYYPPHSLDIIFVLDVTASMMSGGSRKMAFAKRALIQTIEMLWQKNRKRLSLSSPSPGMPTFPNRRAAFPTIIWAPCSPGGGPLPAAT